MGKFLPIYYIHASEIKQHRCAVERVADRRVFAGIGRQALHSHVGHVHVVPQALHGEVNLNHLNVQLDGGTGSIGVVVKIHLMGAGLERCPGVVGVKRLVCGLTVDEERALGIGRIPLALTAGGGNKAIFSALCCRRHLQREAEPCMVIGRTPSSENCEIPYTSPMLFTIAFLIIA